MNVGFSATMPKPVAAPAIRRQEAFATQAVPVFAGKPGKTDKSNLLLIGLVGAGLAFLATTLLKNQRQRVLPERPETHDPDIDRPLVVDKDLDGFR